MNRSISSPSAAAAFLFAAAAFFTLGVSAAAPVRAETKLPDPSRSVFALRAAAEVKEENLHLSDFLAETSLLESAADKIIPAEVVAGLSPAFGKILTIRRADLDTILARVLPKDSYTWAGAKECVISRPCEEISERQVSDRLESALRIFTNKEGDLRVVRILNYTSLIVPKEEAVMEVELVSPNTRTPFGTATVDVNYRGKLYSRRNLRFEWEWKNPVWIAAEAVGAGRAKPALFIREPRNVLTLPGEIVPAEALPDDLVISRAIAKGDPLLRANVTSAVVVSRGAAVTAEVRSGAMLISMKAVALESGSVGQTIRVQNPQSRKEILGKITHANIVEIIP